MSEGRVAADPDAWKSARILIVDDNDDNRQLLSMVMKRAGLRDLAFAADGVEGLDQVFAFKPDLVLLDVQMPNMDGYEMCRRVRQDEANIDLPVIFQTALTGSDERVACFEAGGTDLVSKPINRREVVSRVRIQLEKRFLIRELDAFRRRVAQELAQARSMQAGLAPPIKTIEALSDRVGARIQARFRPSSEVGGDMWTLFPFDGRRFGLLLADFAGHGVGAAMNAFRLHAMASALDADTLSDPGALLTLLNDRLCGLLPLGQFATAFYGVLDLEAGRLLTAPAGAPGAFFGGPGRAPEMIESRGRFLGVSKKSTFETRAQDLPERGWLFAYSDALSDAVDHDGEKIAEAGVGERAAEAAERPLQERLSAMMAPLDSGAFDTDDDLTAIWIDWTGDA